MHVWILYFKNNKKIYLSLVFGYFYPKKNHKLYNKKYFNKKKINYKKDQSKPIFMYEI